MAEIDWDAYRTLETELPDAQWRKYFAIDRYRVRNVTRLVELGLVDVPPQRVLDLGCGTGLFLAGCKSLGHAAVGVNLADPLFDRTVELFGVQRIVHRIEPHLPFPDLPGSPFDLVTAFETQFDIVEGVIWGVDDWKGLFAQLRPHLHHDSRVFIKLNQHAGLPADQIAPPDVRAYFESLNAPHREAVRRSAALAATTRRERVKRPTSIDAGGERQPGILKASVCPSDLRVPAVPIQIPLKRRHRFATPPPSVT